MNTSRTLSFPVTLTTAQLSYLLTIVQSPPLFGADNQQLFPENDDERAQLWKTGQQQLKRDAWLIQDDEFTDINAQLLLLVTQTAAANTILLSQLAISDRPVQAVTHYVSDTATIEVTYNNGIYQLTALDSLAVMANRLAYMFDLPSSIQDIAFEMTQEQIQYLQSALDTADNPDLTVPNLPPNATLFYIGILRHLQHKGMVQFIRIDATHIVTREQIGVLVSSDGRALTAVSHQQKTMYQSTTLETFQQALIKTVEQL